MKPRRWFQSAFLRCTLHGALIYLLRSQVWEKAHWVSVCVVWLQVHCERVGLGYGEEGDTVLLGSPVSELTCWNLGDGSGTSPPDHLGPLSV